MRTALPKPILVLLAWCGIAVIAAGTAPVPDGSLQRFEFSKVLMGVRMNIVLYAPDAERARRAGEAAFRRIAEIEQIASTYRPTSEIMLLQKQADRGPVPVSEDLFRMLELSLDLHARTGGAFDCTVGHLVERWRQAARGGPVPIRPPASEPRHLVLEPVSQTVELRNPAALDLNGLAKGYAGDEAMEALRALGIAHALIDLSGDIVAGDPPPGAESWDIAMELGDPIIPRLHLRLANAACATSGDSEAHFEIDGVRYSHIIDPRTSMPCTTRSAACVIAPTGALADGLATAMCVLGPTDGPDELMSFRGADAIIVAFEDETHRSAATPGFMQYLREHEGGSEDESSK